MTMSAAPVPDLKTAEELIRLPDDGYCYELDEGRLVWMLSSAYRSSRVASRVHIRLGSFVDQHDLGAVSGEGGGVLLGRAPDIVRAPDVAFVRKERVVDTGRGYFEGAPDLVIEVLSPSDRYAAVARKMSQYLAAGTRLGWVLDPETRTAAVHRPGREVEELPEDGVLDGEDVVAGFRLSLTEVWV
jgi:Uma2 family endonuclease